MRDFNRGEGIEVDPAEHARALDRLLGEPSLGRVWIAHAGSESVGYAVVGMSYDLEHPGVDAFLTELYVRPEARGRGAGRAMLAAVEQELRVLGVVVLHLAVRPDNESALGLYRTSGYRDWTRTVMSKPLKGS